MIRTGTTSSKFSKSTVSLLWNQSYFSPLSRVQWTLQQPVATFGAVYMEMLHSHVAALVHSCGMWHTVPDGANSMGPQVHLPPTVNPHLIFLSWGSHIVVILYECKIWAFQKPKCLGAKATFSNVPEALWSFRRIYVPIHFWKFCRAPICIFRPSSACKLPSIFWKKNCPEREGERSWNS